ncbi:nuclear autoantigenic sperm protein isoform X1 [Pimephales promelas]|uniref:nuclear autoantigenic sperm protein isoform X1 n=1 Tax=Pimephales promelas TaxID=90988 RepID=UPI0019556288|nr:nuclear autoantigenic sperm protein isoform X1 [Pimephales promelas]KAG1938494.1 nuclear autoantigenic sperm protein [Pimephales promelas]
MPEETASASTAESMAVEPCSSSAADSSVDVTEEAKKLIGTGNRHLVMGDVVAAVSVFQEACAMLAEKYGDTADECGEAFFLCGKALLELARMENTVLGNALEGVPEESSEEGEKQNDSKIESADNLDEETRDELRAQVYDAMSADNKTQSEVETEVGEGEQKNQEDKQNEVEVPKEADAASPKSAKPAEREKLAEDEAKPGDDEKISEDKAKPDEKEKLAEDKAKPAENEKLAEDKATPAENEELAEDKATPAENEKLAEDKAKPAENEKLAEDKAKPAENEKLAEDKAKPAENEKLAEDKATPAENEEPADKDVKANGVDEGASKKEDITLSNSEKAEKDEEKNEDTEEPMEEDGGDDDEDDDDDEDGEGDSKDKESEEDEVGNLQLAWEMLEVAKVIYKRKDCKEDQLMAAQIYLKLGEVGAESGNYSQALEDFNECLTLQLKHLPSHSRLLAETHYQLGTTYCYTAQYSQAIEHFSKSIKVIESRLAMLQEVIDKTEGAEATKEKTELEELKQLLPEITEKIEDAKEGQRTAAVASEAIHQTLAGASTSSAFPAENGGPSSSTASQIPVKPADGASSSKSASDISHLVRKKRKPDEESPKKDSDAKKTKQETSVNGSDDSAHNGNGVQEKMEQESANSSSVETSA